MPTFALRLIAPRPNFAQTMTDSEREIMNRHAAHWRPYLERGEMVVFGPVLTDEDSYGLAVVETDDEQALREFAAQDPVVTSATAAFELDRCGARSRALTERCTVAPSRVAPAAAWLGGERSRETARPDAVEVGPHRTSEFTRICRVTAGAADDRIRRGADH
jgi:uncharacterized protein